MRRLQLIGIVLFLLILGLSASAALSNPPSQPPPPPTEVRLSAKDDSRQIELSENQLLVITLEGNPSTGYIWEVGEVDEKVLRQVGDIEFQSLSRLLGAPAKEILRFQALEEGQTALKLVYHRPWEKDVAPARTFSIQVQAVGPFTGVDSSSSISDTQATAEPKSSLESPLPVPDQSQLGLPPSFNWCDAGGCTPVKNQGNCGSCWAFSTVGTLESKIKLQDTVEEDLSEQYLVSCNTDYWDCCGGWWAHDYHQWKIPPSESQAGAVMEAVFPYGSAAISCGSPEVSCSGPYTHTYQIDSWAFVGPEYGVPSVADIKQAIYDHGPVSVAVCVGSAFIEYTGGVFQTNESCEYVVNHAVVLVGWNDTDGAWILRNSWGSTWGESGYMRIKYGTSNVGYSANYIFYSELTNKVHLPLAMKNYPFPGGWVTIMSEDFEGTWPGGWDLWEGGAGDYKWKKRDCRPYGGSYSGWAVGGGADGSLLACQANYPHNAYSWMIYGPFSLADATAADLRFKLWLKTELDYDGVCRMASTNGINFSGWCASGNSGGWTDQVLDLAGYTGQPNVWVALIFDSDSTINYAEGGYVDNIVLRKYVGAGVPAPAVEQPVLPEGAQIVDTPATLILEP